MLQRNLLKLLDIQEIQMRISLFHTVNVFWKYSILKRIGNGLFLKSRIQPPNCWLDPSLQYKCKQNMNECYKVNIHLYNKDSQFETIINLKRFQNYNCVLDLFGEGDLNMPIFFKHFRFHV